MGVIDLDARVKKLEQDSGSSAEIDQIEADLTSLENAVSGYCIPVKTEVTQLDAGTPEAVSAGGVYYEVMGNLVHIHMTAGGFTVDTRTTSFTLPESVRPASPIFAVGYAGTADSNKLPAYLIVKADGSVDVLSPTGYIYCDAVFLLTPASEEAAET